MDDPDGCEEDGPWVGVVIPKAEPVFGTVLGCSIGDAETGIV